jgi:hypothetical protein
MSKPNWNAWDDAMEERAPKPSIKLAPPPTVVETHLKPVQQPAHQPVQQPAKPPAKQPSAWELKQRKMNAAVRQHMQQESAWHKFRNENSSKVYHED